MVRNKVYRFVPQKHRSALRVKLGEAYYCFLRRCAWIRFKKLFAKPNKSNSIQDLKERGRVGDKLIEVLRELNALGDLPEDEQMTLF